MKKTQNFSFFFVPSCVFLGGCIIGVPFARLTRHSANISGFCENHVCNMDGEEGRVSKFKDTLTNQLIFEVLGNPSSWILKESPEPFSIEKKQLCVEPPSSLFTSWLWLKSSFSMLQNYVVSEVIHGGCRMA